MIDPPSGPGVSIFGQTRAGQHVERVFLTGGGLTASLLTRGVTLQGLWLEGVPHSLTLGLGDLNGYETATSYLGALVGPVANRIRGAEASLAGQTHRFEANEGRNTLHSGSSGLHARIWQLAEVSDDAASFTLELPHGDGGFPGNRRLTARYSLPGDRQLRLQVTATTDRLTWMNIAQHSYWNLDGRPQWDGHHLRVLADHWLPVDAQQLPANGVAAVNGAMDFRLSRRIQQGQPALDHTFCLAPARRDVTHCADLAGALGVHMQMSTTEPGLQVYDGRSPVRPGGLPYEGLALEPQGWPDAPNRGDFPSTVIGPEVGYAQTTTWVFRG